MEYVNLGSTGLKVSRICLGCMTYGSRKWREWVLEEPESRPLIRQAIEAGINFFDTADMYSVGGSEEILGRALKEFGPPRDRLVIATKVFGAMGDDLNQRGLSRKHIFHAIDDSLRSCRRTMWTFTRFTAMTRPRRWRRLWKRCTTSCARVRRST